MLNCELNLVLLVKKGNWKHQNVLNVFYDFIFMFVIMYNIQNHIWLCVMWTKHERTICMSCIQNYSQVCFDITDKSIRQLNILKVNMINTENTQSQVTLRQFCLSLVRVFGDSETTQLVRFKTMQNSILTIFLHIKHISHWVNGNLVECGTTDTGYREKLSQII